MNMHMVLPTVYFMKNNIVLLADYFTNMNIVLLHFPTSIDEFLYLTFTKVGSMFYPVLNIKIVCNFFFFLSFDATCINFI